MILRTAITSLFAAAAMMASRVASQEGATSQIVQDAFIFEFEEGQDPSSFVARLGGEGKTRVQFNHTFFNGVSVQLNPGEDVHERALLLAEQPVVKRIWPVRLVAPPNDRVEWVAHADRPDGIGASKIVVDGPDTWQPHVTTQVDKLRAKGITGKGIRVAIVDSGIDYMHPALGGCFGEGCLVSFGTDLVGDDYNGYNTPVPDPDPMDCLGHGTHVAGIIAAQQNVWNFTGAAPDVELGIYRVFGCADSTADDVLMNAFIQAYVDGADIISSSIGGPSGWPEDPWSVLVSRMVEAGVPCVLSAGNDGPKGLFYPANAAQGHGVISAASVNSPDYLVLYSLSNYTVDAGVAQRFQYVPGAQLDWDGIRLPLFVVGLDPPGNGDACKPLTDNTLDLSKAIVLIQRGNCSLAQQAQNVADRGAQRLLISDNGYGIGVIDLSAVKQIVSSGMVRESTRTSWVKNISAGHTIHLSMLGPDRSTKVLYTAPNNLSGGTTSTFSSWGPTFEMDTKPQVSAPGGFILSTYPLALGAYAVMSGTSMAAPLIASIMALIAQARDTRDPALIRHLISTTAKPLPFNNGTKSFDFLAPVPQQGSGLVQAYDAAYATTLISPSSLSFNDTEHFARSRNFTINNSGDQPVTFHLSHIATHSFYTYASNDLIRPAHFPNEDTEKHASLSFSDNTLTLGAGEFTTIQVLCAPPVDIDRSRLPIWSGFISINGSDGSSFTLPYQGASGSLRSRVVLETSGAWMANSSDAKLNPVANGTTFRVPGPGSPISNSTSLPSIAYTLVFGSSLVRADIVSMSNATGVRLPTTDFFGVQSLGQPMEFPLSFQPRVANSTAWNGQLNDGNYVPPGPYKVVVSALRVFGNATQRRDWDRSETNWFVLDYSG